MSEEQDCYHEDMIVHSGDSGARGFNPHKYSISCADCLRTWSGPTGLSTLLGSIKTDQAEIWLAVERLGGRRPAAVAKVDPDSVLAITLKCQHHLGWLQITGGGDGGRGSTHKFTVSCLGCRESWISGAGLKVFCDSAKRERIQIWAQIAKLNQAAETAKAEAAKALAKIKAEEEARIKAAAEEDLAAEAEVVAVEDPGIAGAEE